MIAQPGLRHVVLVAATLVMAACASKPAQPVAAPGPGHVAAGDRAASIALAQVGAPYRYGGNTPGGFDCSGLVQYAYLRAGLSAPRTTSQLWSAAETVGVGELRAGDLLFFRVDGKMSHVGLYVGRRQFVHAPRSGRTVSVESLDAPFYRAALIRAGRLY